MTRQERTAGLLLIILGVWVAYYGLFELKIGTIGQPGPGFFPFISGAGIVILCLIWMISNRNCILECQPLWAKGQWVGPVLAVVVTTAYTALMEPLGYALSTLVFLIGWQKLIERENWRKTSIIAVVATAGMYLVFAYLLGIDLPVGELFD